jgi:hypothetical protein
MCGWKVLESEYPVLKTMKMRAGIIPGTFFIYALDITGCVPYTT